MDCRNIEKLLVLGRPLTAEAQKHVQDCAACLSMADALDALSRPVHAIQLPGLPDDLLSRLDSVKPLPSDPVLISLAMAAFVGFSLLVEIVIGLQGLSHLTTIQRIVYYGVVTLCGVLFSTAAVQAAIPGARVRIGRGVAAVGSLAAVGVTAALLFQNFALDRFIALGIPCLRLSCICAALFGSIAAIVLRRGCVTDPRAATVLTGCFAGFAGVAVLSLHCPLQNTAHIITWHLGTVAVSAFSGLAVAATARY